MLVLITTGDDEKDAENIEMLADNIHQKAAQMHADYLKQLKINDKGLAKEIKKSEPEQKDFLLEQHNQMKNLID